MNGCCWRVGDAFDSLAQDTKSLYVVVLQPNYGMLHMAPAGETAHDCSETCAVAQNCRVGPQLAPRVAKGLDYLDSPDSGFWIPDSGLQCARMMSRKASKRCGGRPAGHEIECAHVAPQQPREPGTGCCAGDTEICTSGDLRNKIRTWRTEMLSIRV